MGRGVGFAERKRDNYLAFREGHSVIPIVTVEGYEDLFLPLEDLDSSSQIKTRLPQRTGATPSPSWWPRPSATGSCRADRGMSSGERESPGELHSGLTLAMRHFCGGFNRLQRTDLIIFR